MQKKLSKKNIVITGAAQGIGLELSDYFLNNNYNVINLDIKKSLNKDVSNIIFDLNKIEQIPNLVKKLYKKNKHIDVLINNARSGVKKKFLNETSENWDRSFNVNLKSHFFLTQELLKFKKKNKYLAVINISSVVSELISEESASYHLTKASLDMLTKYFAYNCAKLNSSIFSLKLGMILQKRYKKKFLEKKNASFRKKVLLYQNGSPYGTVSDISSAIKFLISEDSRFLNGNILNLTGGSTLGEQLTLLTKKNG